MSLDGMSVHFNPNAPLWLPSNVVRFLLRAATETKRLVLLAEENEDWSKHLK
jgi:hypothetical protein